VNKGILVLLAALVAASALLAGCGGSDDDASGSEATLTKAQYVQKANAICDKGSKATADGYDAFYNRYPVSEGRELTKAQEVELVRVVIIPNVDDQARQLEKLPAPEGDEAEVAAFVDTLNGAVEALESEPLSFYEPGAGNPLLPAAEEAGAYGLTHCGPAS
jgi:hypothetical protein